MRKPRSLTLVFAVLPLGGLIPTHGTTTPLPWVTTFESTLDDRPDRREAVKALLADLAALVRKSGRADPGDAKAIERIERLGREFQLSGPHDKTSIIRGVERVFLAKRRAKKDGTQSTALFIIAARTLGNMGDEAAPSLIRWIDRTSHRKDLPLQKELILSLGRTKDERGRKHLQKLLKDVRPTFKAASATALGMFTHEPSQIRKELFEDLMKSLLQAEANARGQDSTAQAIYSALKGPATSSMRKLSRATASSPTAWQRWWNKNKRRDWDA